MPEDKVWIIWTGDDRVEGVVLRDEGDALWTSTGNERMLSCEGVFPTLGDCLRSNAARGRDLPIEEVDIGSGPLMLPAPAQSATASRLDRLIGLLPEKPSGLVDILERMKSLIGESGPKAWLCQDLRFDTEPLITRDAAYAAFLGAKEAEWSVTPLYAGIPKI